MSEQSREVRRVRRMLRDLGQMAQEASLTGSFQDGARSAVSQYNRVLDHLAQIGETPGTLFGRLEENATFDEVGVAARQLASFLEEDEDEGRGKHKGASHGGHNNVHINVGSLDELKDLGRVIRESMPEWLRDKIPTAPEPPEPTNGANLSERVWKAE